MSDGFPEAGQPKMRESAFLIPFSPQSTSETSHDVDEDEGDDEIHTIQPINLITIVGGILIIATVGLAIIGASIFRYPVTVRAEASVRPRGELQLVQAAAEGSVIRIFVQENQGIRKGDIIAKLDNSRLQIQKSQLQIQIQQTNSELEQIQSQILKQDSQILSERERISRTIASAEAELARIQRTYRDQSMTAVMQVEEAQANLNLVRQEWQKARSDYQSALADFKSIKAAHQAALTKTTRYKKALEEGAISQDSFQEIQLNAVQKEQAVASQNSVIAAKEQTIEQQNQAVIAAQTRLAAAKVTLNPSNAEVKGYRQRVAEETARGKALITTLKKERYGLLQQQIRTMQQLDNAEKELRQVELLLRQTLIAAPTDGILFNLNLRNAGQMVRASEEIAKIAPSHTPLVVKAQVAAADIGKVKLTQQVQVRVSACPYPDYGTLKGQVRAIAPDAISPANISPTSGQKPGESENRFYEVVIEPESRRLAQAGKTCDIQLGMAGKVDIITKEETLMQFLFRKARLITDL